jgi:hypothetical protein
METEMTQSPASPEPPPPPAAPAQGTLSLEQTELCLQVAGSVGEFPSLVA